MGCCHCWCHHARGMGFFQFWFLLSPPGGPQCVDHEYTNVKLVQGCSPLGGWGLCLAQVSQEEMKKVGVQLYPRKQELSLQGSNCPGLMHHMESFLSQGLGEHYLLSFGQVGPLEPPKEDPLMVFKDVIL